MSPDEAGCSVPPNTADLPTPEVRLSYSASSDVVLLSLQDSVEFSQVSFAESSDIFVATKDGKVVGVLFLNAGALIGEDRLARCERLDTLSLPRLGDEPF